jgi:surfactin synthase thioesterase subunit
MNKINLFCLPFAGGSKYSYRDFEENTVPFLNIFPLEYPGRGARNGEFLLKVIDLLVDDVYKQIKETLIEADYAIYGHSMGGLIGWLLARKIIDEGHKPPLHLFISGASSPCSVSRRNIKMHSFEKVELVKELERLKGSSDEILKNLEFLEYYEPILRADFEAVETYEYKESNPIEVPFTVITGTEEDFEQDDVVSWQKESTYEVDFKLMNGHHFFIFNQPISMIDIFSGKLVHQINSRYG